MILIDLETELNFFKGKTIPCQCEYCEKIYSARRAEVNRVLRFKKLQSNLDSLMTFQYCSRLCANRAISIDEVFTIECKNCGESVRKRMCDSRKSKTKNFFCNSSCAATFNNAHKTKGYRRSKLEVWLEASLISAYPNLEIHFNKKNAISSELDIYIPSLNLAIELNGIFHYKPIYGDKTFTKIKNNDVRKVQTCLQNKIKLFVINVSHYQHFKETCAKEVFSLINGIIIYEGKVGFEPTTDALRERCSAN